MRLGLRGTRERGGGEDIAVDEYQGKTSDNLLKLDGVDSQHRHPARGAKGGNRDCDGEDHESDLNVVMASLDHSQRMKNGTTNKMHKINNT